MKKVIVAVIVLAVASFLAWKFVFKKDKKEDGTKPEGLVVSQHSLGFNQSMQTALDSYFTLTEAFVNWDTAAVNNSIAGLKNAVDSIAINEMEKDTAIYPTVFSQWESIKAEIEGMKADTGLYTRREDLNMLSQQFFDLLRIVKYDATKIFYQECPMALDGYESSAFWLSTASETKKRRNPYLGLYDPKFGRSMLTCGTTRDSINFASGSTEK